MISKEAPAKSDDETVLQTPAVQPELSEERRRTHQLLSLVREPTGEEKAALEKIGLTLFEIYPKSLECLGRENKDHFDHINSSESLRTYTPPSFFVAINPIEPFVLASFKKPQTEQLVMVGNRSSELQKKIPDVREVLLPASALVQLDMACFKEKGHRLFKDSFALASDKVSDSSSVVVGRFRPESRLLVSVWNVQWDYEDVGVLRAVVFISK